MSFFSWLRNRTSNHPRRDRAQHRPTPPRFRPRLEALEDRWLPSTLTVTNNLDSGAGSLRADIAAAKNNDTIVFAPSLDGQTITLTSGVLSINGIINLTIQGPGAGQLTVSGNNNFTVFVVGAKAKDITLSGLTISNGLTTRDGGGIYNAGMLTVSGCTLSGNTASYGGGIYNAGTLTVSGCTVDHNFAQLGGGGIYNAFQGKLTVSGCTVDYNADQLGGGGIYNAFQGKLTVSGCTVDYNAGGIRNDGNAGALTISNSVFYANYPDVQGLFTDGGGNTFG